MILDFTRQINSRYNLSTNPTWLHNQPSCWLKLNVSHPLMSCEVMMEIPRQQVHVTKSIISGLALVVPHQAFLYHNYNKPASNRDSLPATWKRQLLLCGEAAGVPTNLQTEANKILCWIWCKIIATIQLICIFRHSMKTIKHHWMNFTDEAFCLCFSFADQIMVVEEHLKYIQIWNIYTFWTL